MDIPRITVQELKAIIDRNEPATVLDVRLGSAYATSPRRIKGAERLDPDNAAEIEAFAKTHAKDSLIVTYCT